MGRRRLEEKADTKVQNRGTNGKELEKNKIRRRQKKKKKVGNEWRERTKKEIKEIRKDDRWETNVWW